jgi:glycosyltransferase involved in cell wall biosynthesis
MAKKITQSPAISVIVTVFNEADSIEDLLNSLASQTYLPAEVVITDGGSTDGTVPKLRKLQKRFAELHLKIIEFPSNRSQGRNRAILEAKHDWLAITDAGCVPHQDWLEQLVKVVIEYAPAAQPVGVPPVIAGFYDAQPQTPLQEAVVPYLLVMPDQADPSTFLPATRSMMMHRSVWRQMSGFDERLYEAGEDYAFARAVVREKIPIVFAREAKVTWQSFESLSVFFKVLKNHAEGDAKSGYLRPKVALLFGRYLVGIAVMVWLIGIGAWEWALGLMLSGGLVYSAWAIKKNGRYAPNGWLWLPVLQYLADTAVMWGTVRGFGKRAF